jgi:pimeloyl-ACP methyl ester carboxylesterase
MVEGLIRLSNGRHLDYLETGPPDAPAVLYCHGTPGSRLELLFAKPALDRNDVHARLMALNRPGYGRSSFVSSHGFLPWARDVDEAADRLGLDRFAILGASGGSPFALACAYSLADRIKKVGITAGVAPPDIPGMEQAAVLVNEYERTIRRVVRHGSLYLANRMGLSPFLVRRLIASLGPADRQALGDPEATNVFQEIVGEAFAQWGRAAALEAGLLMRPWDFDPSLVTQQVRLWHGGDDTRIPAKVATAFTKRMPHAHRTVWPHHGHFSWAMSDDIADVIDFLTHGEDQRIFRDGQETTS